MINNAKNEKICILGCSGMLGAIVFDFLEEKGYDCLGVTVDTFVNLPNVHIIDVLDFDVLEKKLDESNPTVLINCIGLLNKDCDLKISLAFYLNSVFPHLLNEYCIKKNVYLIHVSTDYVFSGKDDIYYLDSKKDGEGYYSISKSFGEIPNSKNTLTVRTSFIGPNKYYPNKGLLNWFMSQTEVNGFDNVFWSGVTTIQFARFADYCIKNGKPTGIIHLVNETIISKYDLLQLFNSKLVNPVMISKVQSTKNICIKLAPTKIGFVVPPYEEMVDEMFVWIKEYKKDYHFLANRIKIE